jgi:hypothetical protein
MTQNVVLAVNTSAAARTAVYFSMTGAAAAAVVAWRRPLTARGVQKLGSRSERVSS